MIKNPRAWSLFVAALLLVALLSAAGQASAQQDACSPVTVTDPDNATLRAARGRFGTGVELLASEQWADARAAFREAYEGTGKSSIFVNIATAEAHLGRLVEAEACYERVLADPEAAQVHPNAQSGLDEVRTRIPRMTLDLQNQQPTDVVTIDGAPISSSALSVPLQFNPGTHEVIVMREGTEVARENVALVEGQQQVATIELPALDLTPEVAANTVVPDPGPVALEEPMDEDSGGVFESPWFWIITGVVLAGAGVAAWLLFFNDSQEPFSGNLGQVELN